LLEGAEALQCANGGTHGVERVGATQRLGKDVADARSLDDGAHCATGDDTGARGSGFEQHLGTGVGVADHVRNGGASQRHQNQVLLGVFDAFFDGLGHFARLSETHTHMARTVTQDDQRAIVEAPSAFDHF
jgi:hypothetical protein